MLWIKTRMKRWKEQKMARLQESLSCLQTILKFAHPFYA